MANDRFVVWVSAVVVLAIVALAGFVVVRLGSANPTVIAGVFTAMAGMLAAVPPIIRALRGGGR